MMNLQKLAVAGIAAIGAVAIAAPASAATTGLQAQKLVTTSEFNPGVMLAGYNNHNKNKRMLRKRNSNNQYHKRGGHRSYRDYDNDGGINLSFGIGVPLLAYGGFNDYGGSYLHCHGRKYSSYGRTRCRGDWHRHYDY
ncbi:MAG: hypothetical protein M3N38_02835 [Pseudomonadota bacterium]|nr:hypothetical protein [Pseudomonadota bacterium]